MATDFRFNGQQSYSPLLSALAEAPQNKAKLAILQEQNRRQRLSDLLSNLSSGATLGRSLQQWKAITDQQNLAKQQSPVLGAAAGVNPDAYAQGIAGVGAPFSGLDAVMGGGAASQPSPLQGEGVTPGDQGVPRGTNVSQQGIPSPQAPNQDKKTIIMNKLFPGQYELSTDPNTGLRQMVSKIPGLPIIPIDGTGPQGLITDPKDLNPVQLKAIPEFADKFAADSKPEQEVLLNTKEFKSLAASKNPISDTTLKLLAPRLTGIVARINPTTLDAYGGSSAVVDKINASLQRAKTGKLTDTDRSFMIDLANNVESSANQALKQKLSDAVSKAQVSVRGVDTNLLAKSIGGNTQDRINGYKPLSSISNGPGKIPASARFKQLSNKGLNKRAVYSQMHDEGY